MVTGCSSGIGLEVSSKYIDLGYKVVGISRNPPSIPLHCHYSVDLTDQSTLSPVIGDIKSNFKSIHRFINCAGVMHTSSALRIDYELMLETFQVNVLSPIFLTSSLTKNLSRGNASVIYVGSVASDLNINGELVYSASKAALKKSLENFAVELSRFGISFFNIQPAICESPMTSGLSDDSRSYMISKSLRSHLLTCADVADFIISTANTDSLASGSSLYCGGICR